MSELNTIPGNTVEIALSVPYTALNGTPMASVTMRSPTVRDRIMHLNSTKSDIESNVDMIANLCGLSANDLMNMEACDFFRLEKQFNDFLLPPEKRTFPK